MMCHICTSKTGWFSLVFSDIISHHSNWFSSQHNITFWFSASCNSQQVLMCVTSLAAKNSSRLKKWLVQIVQNGTHSWHSQNTELLNFRKEYKRALHWLIMCDTWLLVLGLRFKTLQILRSATACTIRQQLHALYVLIVCSCQVLECIHSQGISILSHSPCSLAHHKWVSLAIFSF